MTGGGGIGVDGTAAPAGATPAARRVAAPLPRGTVLDGRFEVLELLGEGGFGEVYRADQFVFGIRLREVALKLFAPEFAEPDRAREAFQDAMMLLRLQEDEPSAEVSRRMVQVYDAGVVNAPMPRPFLSMKLVPGRKTLGHEIRRASRGGYGMPVSLCLSWLRRLLIPLAWMHTRDPAAAHGDLKPENVLVTPGSDLVLTDFGLAARMPMGVRGGTLPYEAAEVLLTGKSPLALEGGTESDVFSVGVMWYQMLTGRLPYDGVGLEAHAADDAAAVVKAHYASRAWPFVDAADAGGGRGGVPRPSAFNAEMKDHPRLEAMIERCMTRAVSARFHNALALLTEVERYRQERSIPDVIGQLPDTLAAARGTARPGLAAPDLHRPPGRGDTPAGAAVPPLPTAAVPPAPAVSPEVAVKEADEFLRQGRPREAVRLLRPVVQRHPRSLAVHVALVRGLAAADDHEAAKQAVKELEKVGAGSREVLLAKAAVHRAAGRTDVADSLEDMAGRRP